MSALERAKRRKSTIRDGTHLDGLELVKNLLRDGSLAEVGHPTEGSKVLDGHDSWDDRDGDA